MEGKKIRVRGFSFSLFFFFFFGFKNCLTVLVAFPQTICYSHMKNKYNFFILKIHYDRIVAVGSRFAVHAQIIWGFGPMNPIQ